MTLIEHLQQAGLTTQAQFVTQQQQEGQRLQRAYQAYAVFPAKAAGISNIYTVQSLAAWNPAWEIPSAAVLNTLEAAHSLHIFDRILIYSINQQEVTHYVCFGVIEKREWFVIAQWGPDDMRALTPNDIGLTLTT